MAATYDELDRLVREYNTMFDAKVRWGFGVGLSKIPMLRRCIERKDNSEFLAWEKKWLDRVEKEHLVY